MKKLTRQELFAGMGIIQVVTPELEGAWDAFQEREWRRNLNSSPHGTPWHTSFHASSFPGDWDKACARKALYELLDIPSKEPFPAFVSAIGDVGKAIELMHVDKFDRAGILLSAPPNSNYQTRFEVPELWLSGSVDAVIRPGGWNRPHAVEIKSKSQAFLEKLKASEPPDPDHERQLMAYIGMAYATSHVLWPELEPATSGSLIYASRDKPLYTHELYYDIDFDFIEAGAEKLKEWISYFKDEELPERPKEWRWTEAPCDWCDVKKLCKQDTKDGITKLGESNAVKYAEEFRRTYEYETVRWAVINRWE